MSKPNQMLTLWHSMSTKPGGKWAFSRLVSLKAPYFSSICPTFVELRPGYCEIAVRKRRGIQNHIGTVHAIAMCNMAELAAGSLTDIMVPSSHRWIPKSMSVEYLKKAETDLRAVAELDVHLRFDAAMELPVTVHVLDTSGQEVFRAVIQMWVTTKKSK